VLIIHVAHVTVCILRDKSLMSWLLFSKLLCCVSHALGYVELRRTARVPDDTTPAKLCVMCITSVRTVVYLALCNLCAVL